MLHALTMYLLTAMVALEPIENHHFYEPRELTEARYTSLAANIAAAVSADGVEPVRASRLESGLLLVSTGQKESHFRAAVMLCDEGGDQDKAGLAHSWGTFQTQRRKAATCESYFGAAVVALDMMRESYDLTGDLRLYTDGPAYATPRARQRAHERMDPAAEWLKQHAFLVGID